MQILLKNKFHGLCQGLNLMDQDKDKDFNLVLKES